MNLRACSSQTCDSTVSLLPDYYRISNLYSTGIPDPFVTQSHYAVIMTHALRSWWVPTLDNLTISLHVEAWIFQYTSVDPCLSLWVDGGLNQWFLWNNKIDSYTVYVVVECGQYILLHERSATIDDGANAYSVVLFLGVLEYYFLHINCSFCCTYIPASR